MEQDLWHLIITFLLKANRLVFLKLSSSRLKIWEFVEMEPHTITDYLNNKNEHHLFWWTIMHNKHWYTICDVQTLIGVDIVI